MQVDWTRVAEAIEVCGASSFEARAAREMVATAYDTWFAEDSESFEILSVEEPRLFQHAAFPTPQDKPFKFVLDLHVRLIKVPAWLKLQKPAVAPGDHLVIDWKTTGYNFSSSYGRDKFTTTYRQSAQWRYYMAALDPTPAFLYRGISKEPKGGTHQLYIPAAFDHANYDALVNALQQTGRVLDNMVADWPLGPWPLVPDSCQKWGRPCPHLATCQTKPDHPRNPVIIPPHLSFSSMQAFWTCPERYRRDRLEGVETMDDGTEASRTGTATHAGLAALYLQLKEHQQR